MITETSALGVKVDHVVHLQDARYCAAAGVQYLTFCLERGHMRKLAENTVWELLEWLSGPQFILDFGLDHAAAEAFVRAPVRTDVWVQIACPLDQLAQAQLPPAHLVSIAFDRSEDLIERQALLEKLIQDEFRIELAPKGSTARTPALPDALLSTGPTWFLQTDSLRVSDWALIQTSSFIPAFREWVQADAFHLDYDRFEELLGEGMQA